MRARLTAGLFLAALPLLSGCVAAAIPVLAAGGVLKTRIDGGTPTPAKGEPRVPIDISGPSRTAGTPASVRYTLPDGTRMEAMSAATPAPQAAGDAPPVP